MAPTYEHEAWRNVLRKADPALLDRLFTAAGLSLPAITTLREASQDASQLLPVQFIADAVLLCDKPTSHVLLFEVQRQPDERKRMSWPAYVASLYAEHKCPVTLLVICPNLRVAKWARVPIAFGTGATLVPAMLGPDELPLGTIAPHSNELDFVLAVLRTAMHAGEPRALQNAKLLGAQVLGTRPEDDDTCWG
jgi:hypothetical protein